MTSEQTLFDLMTCEEKAELLYSAKTIELESGQTLFNRGDKADCFYVLNKGLVKLVRITPQGDEKVFKLFSAGGVIAEMAMFMPNHQYPMTGIVEVNCELQLIPKEQLLSLLERSPSLSVKIMSFMSQRISNLMNSIDTLTQVAAEQRLVMYFAELYLKQNQNTMRIELPFSKKVLASQISITPETLSRNLKKLKQEKLITERGKFIYFSDIDALCRYVNLFPDIFSGSQQVA